MSECILEVRNITKVYDNGFVANKDISFKLFEGEIHAIVGENGAGKSTLMKMLFGMEQPTTGKILVRGVEAKIIDPEEAIKMGIGMVHQHFMLVPSFTVAQNLLLGLEPKRGIFIDKSRAEVITKELALKYNLHVEPSIKVEDLSVGKKQKVEILKALYRGAKVLILDEPTAVLTPQETEELFVQLKQLRNEGHTIIFISHKLKEVKEISDRVTVIRRGVCQGVYDTKDVSEQEISKLMVGRDVVLKYDKTSKMPEKVAFKVRGLSHTIDDKKVLDNISFNIREGEILGIAGVEGNGQSELVDLITRNRRIQSGSIKLYDEDISNMGILETRKKKLSYIPEDRMSRGVAGEASIDDNILANKVAAGEVGKGMILNIKEIKRRSADLIKHYLVKCQNGKQQIGMLSGGNIQKVVVARECSVEPRVLVAAQPTRGVDVGAIEFIHSQLLELRDKDSAILLISADLNEVLELSDSIAVMYEGEIVAYFEDSKEVTEEELGLCMLGLKKHDESQLRRLSDEE